MNAIVNFNVQTMSSREIAALTGKEHRHVKRDCEVMLSELELGAEGYAQNWTHPQNGQTYVEYALTKDLIETLITGYSIKLRHAVLNRLRELEGQRIALPNFNNPAEAARAWADEVEAKQIAEKQIAILEPKAKGLDRLAECTNVLGIREAAKVLKIGQNTLTQYLLDKKVIYRDTHGKLQGYQKSVAQKLIHIVTSTPRLFESGEKVFTQVKLTQKLIARISAWLEKGNLA